MHEQVKLIVERIKELRRISHETMEETAAACGISEADYAAYERGDCDIPVGVLYAISHHFKVELSALLTGDEPHLHSLTLTKNGEGAEVKRRAPYEYQSLAYGFAHKKGEPFLVTVAPGTDSLPELNTHPGQEFNYVVKGKIKLFHNGREYLLEEGDSAFYDSEKPHGMKAVDSQAEFLALIMAD
ncbi:MAG: cupin domain-containing protein [Spirochaetales bacterium]|nr:cupin domain-containing protein [Spirochaetales bacterium]